MPAASMLRPIAAVAGSALMLLAGCQPPAAVVAPDLGAEGVVDPLSMPSTPSLAIASVPSAATCKPCHPTQFAEWSGSRHGGAMTDQVFQALVGVRQQARGGLQDKFCVQCHGVAGVRSGEVHPGFSFAGLSSTSMEGVACVVCHGASEVARPYNAGLTLPLDGAMRGGLADPVPTGMHPAVAAPHLATSLFCASCHDVRELSGLSLERPFEEWQGSPAAATGQTCQDCHMPRYDGPAAVGGPARTGLRSHRFVGFDPPGATSAADPAVRAAFAADLATLLGSAARMSIASDSATAGATLDVAVSVENRIAGHSLPTGSTFLRQCWLEIVATDDRGATLYESGTLDASGDLRDRWSALDPYGDADLVSLSSSFVDAGGTPTLFPWEAAEHHRNALRAGETRTFTYFVPIPPGASGAVHVSARLRMRPAPPFLLRLVKLDALLPLDEPRDLATATALIPLQ